MCCRLFFWSLSRLRDSTLKENISSEEFVEVVEEVVEEEAKDFQNSKDEADESWHCEEQVGESQHGDEARESQDGEKGGWRGR